EPQRGDIIVMKNPDEVGSFYIKRIVGLPGEHVRLVEGVVYINDLPLAEPYVLELCSHNGCTLRDWQLNEGEYFVLGDNRNDSHDSVVFGPIHRSQILGRAWIRYWPPEAVMMINH